MVRRHFSQILFVTILSAVAISSARAQTTSVEAPTDATVVEAIQARLKQLENSPGLDDETRKGLASLYEEAQKVFGQVAQLVDDTKRYVEAALHAPTRIEQAKAELVALPAESTVVVPPGTTLTEIEQAIATRESQRASAKAMLEKKEAEPKQRIKTRSESADRSVKLREMLSKLDAELQAPIDEASPRAVAQRTLTWAKHRSAEQELQAIDRQAAMFEATAELLPIERDLLARRVSLMDQEIKQLQESANHRRQQEADRQVQTAKVDAIQAHPAVRRLAEENAALAEARKEVAQQITTLSAEQQATDSELASVKAQFKKAKEKVEAVGLTNAIGLLLRKQRDMLPKVAHRQRTINQRQLTIAETQLRLLQLRDSRSDIADITTRLRQAMLESVGPTGEASPELEHLVRETLRTQKEYLDALIDDNDSYFEQLVDLDNAERQLVSETEQCSRFIDERVLWITSDSTIEPDDVRHASQALWWLLGPEAWGELGKALMADAHDRPALPLLALGGFGVILFLRSHLRSRLREAGDRARKANCYRFPPTLQALALSVLVAAVWPGLVGYLGWRLSAPLSASELCKAVGVGLLVASRVFFVVELLRVICQSEGLADAHFAWPEAALKALRVNAAWLRWSLPPAVFLAVAMDAQPNDRWDSSLGRAGFLAALMLGALFVQRVLRPQGGVLQNYLTEHRDGWLHRLRYVWYPAGAMLPLVLAVLAGLGYYYTAQQLAARLALTAYSVFGFVVLRSLLLRWVLVSRRKLSIEQTRQRRAQAQAEAAAAGDDAVVCELPTLSVPERDLTAINIQTRRLIEYTLVVAGLLAVWVVWVDVTPALRFLNEVNLWETIVAENVTDKQPDGSILMRIVERPEAVTLANLMLALVALGMTVTAAKNIPGLMELAVLHHLPLDAGVRYAISTVSRYLITIAGLTLACGMIGLGWSKVQWLVAAVGVGLGFGLQEIFANFVSGLIILFERPIRVGDVITVGDITGSVARIHMRATTIIDWDRKELIVPNKEFITGRVLNWTLSDQVNRVVINVGVAYGSDTERVTSLLQGVARQHPHVLSEPAPHVAFEAFGASSLDFVLRCYLASLDNRLTVVHELHMGIERAFREAGIEIAFPQQDVHIRAIDFSRSALATEDTSENKLMPDKPAEAPPTGPMLETIDADAVISRLITGPRPAPPSRRVA